MSTMLDMDVTSPNSETISRRFVLVQDCSIAEQLAVDHQLADNDICLDFANIEAINSAELSALIRFVLRTRQLDRSVFLSHVGDHLQEMFEITRFRALTAS